MTTKIKMYGAEWCGDCRRSKRFLDSNNVTYEYIDVEADSKEDALEIGMNTDGGDFKQTDLGDWNIDFVTEVKQ